MPDFIPVCVPRMGYTATEVTIIEWLAGNDTPVTEGEVICNVETDKTTVEIEAPASGRLEQGAAPGSVHEVGDELGRIWP